MCVREEHESQIRPAEPSYSNTNTQTHAWLLWCDDFWIKRDIQREKSVSHLVNHSVLKQHYIMKTNTFPLTDVRWWIYYSKTGACIMKVLALHFDFMFSFLSCKTGFHCRLMFNLTQHFPVFQYNISSFLHQDTFAWEAKYKNI